MPPGSVREVRADLSQGCTLGGSSGTGRGSIGELR